MYEAWEGHRSEYRDKLPMYKGTLAWLGTLKPTLGTLFAIQSTE